jgi:sarcosine oxidase
MIKRRRLLKSMMCLPALWPLSSMGLAGKAPLGGQRIVVAGAGAFGGWTALALQRAGAEVTLLESFAAGHPRSSSGGETRVIRSMYSKPLYVRMAIRSLVMWQQAERAWGQRLLFANGVLFMGQAEAAGFFQQATQAMTDSQASFETLTPDQLARRYPQINPDAIEQAVFEPAGGYLLARRACQAVVEAFVALGGDYRIAAARPDRLHNGRLRRVTLSDGATLKADAFVFCCGPWLAGLFPELLEPRLEISRQEVYFFGTPAGDQAHDEVNLPIWADFGSQLWYGIPGSERRGFKVANDTRGPTIDPEQSDRLASAAGIAAARDYISQRFPALVDAPLIDARVCQYSNTRDGDFILDRHPEASNLWLVGGGSGHGFKHAPAMGELTAASVLADKVQEPDFSL